MIELHLWILSKFDVCACCSQYVYDSMPKKLHNLLVVRNGVESVEFIEKTQTITRESLHIPEDGIVFVYVGGLISRKNIVWLAESFKKAHGIKDFLIIIGDGPEIKKLNLYMDSNIKITGFVSNPSRYLNIADVYVSASLSEGLPLSSLEALTSGLLLLLSDNLSHEEIFDLCRDYYIGELFHNNTNSFSEANNKIKIALLGHDKNMTSGIAKNLFGASKMVLKYEDIYSS